MKRILLVVAIVVLLEKFNVCLACSRCQGGISGIGGRRKRDAQSEQIIEQARQVLQTFDDELIEKLEPELRQLNQEQQSKFYADLQGVDIAAEAELTGVISEYGNTLTPKKLVKAVVLRIMHDFEDASWLIRIRKFSGRKLNNLVDEFIDKVDDK